MLTTCRAAHFFKGKSSRKRKSAALRIVKNLAVSKCGVKNTVSQNLDSFYGNKNRSVLMLQRAISLNFFFIGHFFFLKNIWHSQFLGADKIELTDIQYLRQMVYKMMTT